MQIVFCPHPPLLVPAVAQGAAGELADLREACDAAVRRLVAGADSVTVLGSAVAPGRWDETAGGSLAGFGLDVRAGGPVGSLPLPLTIGAWLLDRVGWQGRRAYLAVTDEAMVEVRDRVLVMADGTAKRGADAPGHIDERAPAYDKEIAQALAAGDPCGLARLDPALGKQLWAAGVPAFRAVGRSVADADRVTRARLRYDGAPYGVGYFVAEWDVD